MKISIYYYVLNQAWLNGNSATFHKAMKWVNNQKNEDSLLLPEFTKLYKNNHIPGVNYDEAFSSSKYFKVLFPYLSFYLKHCSAYAAQNIGIIRA